MLQIQAREAAQAPVSTGAQDRTEERPSGRRVLVVVPTYNERENLGVLLEALWSQCPDANVLVVDDASPDGTGDLADAIAATEPRLQVLHRAAKTGLGTAYVEGFRIALAQGFELVVEMDADLSHRPEDLPHLIEAAATADLVIGSRNIPGGAVVGWSAIRRMISRGGSLYTRLILSLPVHDCTSGFKCFRREALMALDLSTVRANGYGFQVEVNYLCHLAGLRIVEVPIIFPDRMRGHSKMSSKIVLEAMFVVLGLRLGRRRNAAVAEPVATADG
ncbi:MAG TPA: polyprenol monophosphomannose synthase [Candidatus Dormibacteraeota bacterium]